MILDECLNTQWLDKPEQWDALARLLSTRKTVGFDTEFYNVNVEEQSCVDRALIHVWSIAIRTRHLSPFGFHHCIGWCLPFMALYHPGIRAVLENPAIRKEVHNEPVDAHACKNHGIIIRGARNTLGYIRWKMPQLINFPGRFGLKALMNRLLHREPICTFKQLVTDERTILVSKWKKKLVKGCSCGVVGCRLRKGHIKLKEMQDVEVVREKVEEFQYRLQDIVPGHVRWQLLLDYSIEDSIAALQSVEIAEGQPDPAPFPYGGTRPKFAQAVEEAIIEMEQTGFPRDYDYARITAAQAEKDEETELAWLFRWYVINSGEYGPHWRGKGTKKGVDAIWSSPKKKLALFDSLDFPRSPVWAKGRVKRGEVKLDWAAMVWIASNHPPAKQVLEHLLKLQRIRSGKKYLIKVRNARPLIHPICGPAGDSDEACGAVTGRLGIKGELEAMQLPKAGEKDLYQVRKAIIADVQQY